MPTSKKEFGDWGERLVAEEYKKKGFKIVGQKVLVMGYKQLGEIDLIAAKAKQLVFVEVKARENEEFMPAVEAVGFKKQQRLLKAIKGFIANNAKYQDYLMRIDVALVISPLDGKFQSVNIIEDAIQDNY
ncbi:MAG: hypothetical protein A3J48_02430 [Candidatus Doudnabacteria bacterium RIFCSPHIGHO2_02_FULL_46_11]|uniref:UPF0102 protein A3J48_02430 n=1 Tax=Candidatus Doudnabacteria bacterium RIFCSPHIGHO2_02_FULL_46_11 TaxID=1817832 RepID=A0A1F5P8Q4_9BACT|nr:MAG: hypothetical protein A3J48_02430 [Candidatus Doudnabacteria bacterium RIFCSPHIGHO2_02_FULL_46_11]